MISLHALKGAVRRSLEAQERARSDHERHIARKRLKQQQVEQEWQTELKRREEAARDEDGSRAKARAEQDKQNEKARLEMMAAAIVSRQRKLS